MFDRNDPRTADIEAHVRVGRARSHVFVGGPDDLRRASRSISRTYPLFSEGDGAVDACIAALKLKPTASP